MKEQITYRDIYDLVDSKSNAILNKVDGIEKTFRQEVDDLNVEVNKLKSWQDNITGRITVATVVGGAIATVFLDFIRKKIGV